MSIEVRRVEDRAELEALYAFRYRVYVEEFHMTEHADHERRWLYDPLDEVGVSIALFQDGEVAGSLRLVFMDAVPDRQPLVEKFDMAPALEAFAPNKIVTTSRFVLDRKLRHGKAIFLLIKAGYEEAARCGVRLNYGDCSPHLLPFYEHLGYRRYTRGYNDTAFGYKIPILMLVNDHEFLGRVQSPMMRLAARNSDDAAARAWFAATYPAYTGLESAAFLPEGVFFDLMAKRLTNDPLHHMSLLAGLSQDEAQRFVSSATMLELAPGALVIRKNERDSTLYAVLSGLLEVMQDDNEAPPVAILGPGDTFGEIGFLTAVPRTANVLARTDSTVLVLSGEVMERFLVKEPLIAAKVLLNLSRELAGRVSMTTERLKA